VDRTQAAIVESQPEIAIGPGGVSMASKEVVVLIAQPKRDTGVPTNVTVRGVGAGRSRAAAPGARDLRADVPPGAAPRSSWGGASASASTGRGSASPCASAVATGRGRRVRRGRFGIRLRDLGRREQMIQAFRRQAFSSWPRGSATRRASTS